MAGLSRSVWTLLEQLSSTDLQTGFRIAARDTLEAFRYLAGDRAVVLGGLVVTGTATGVSVAPGALLAPFAAGSGSAPRSDESPFVFGRSAEAKAVAIAVPGANTWYAIAARPIEVDTRESRLVLNQTTGEHLPETVLVRRDTALEVQAIAGTTLAPPELAPGWVPLALVLRRSSGGAIPASDIFDMRPLALELEPANGTERIERHDYTLLSRFNPAQLRVDVDLVDRAGRRLTAHATTAISSILAPGLSPASNDWLYLYLSPYRGSPIKTATGRGILVLSDVEPSSQGGRANSAAINSPILGYTILADEATCIGVLRTETYSGNDYVPQHCVSGRHAFGHQAPTHGWSSPVSPDIFPRNARRANFDVKASGSGTAYVTLVSPSGLTVPLLEGTHAAYAMIDAGTVSHQLFPSFDLVGVNITDIELGGLSSGSEMRLSSFDL